jgi:ABC-type nitrate/sulfonate/bicarbonate transport system permease component
MSFLNPHDPLPASTSRKLALAGVITALTVWSLLSGLHIVSSGKLPAPWEVLRAFSYLSWDGARGTSPLLWAVGASLGRILLAALCTVAVGVPLGILMGASPKVNATLSPLIDPFRSAPIVAVLPIIVMWFGIGETMKVFFLWLGGVVYLIPMVRDAIRAVPEVYFIKPQDLGATDYEAIMTSVYPMAKPRIWDAITVAVSIQWTYITVAEYVNASSGIGKLISDSKRFSAMDQVFAEIATIIVLALLTYQGMVWARKKLYPWETA